MVRKRKPKIIEGEEFFNEFWAEWVDGRRVESPSVRVELKKLKPDDDLKKKIMEGLRNYKAFWKQKGTELEHIPSPRKWIRNRRWEDDIPGFTERKESERDHHDLVCLNCNYRAETIEDGVNVRVEMEATYCLMCPELDGPFADPISEMKFKVRD